MTEAFCPGHISCVFQPRRHGDPLRSGSRGIGFCIDRGATADVSESDRLRITLNGEEGALVTEEAFRILGFDRLEVSITTELPVSQGFAMSAAGTIAAALAAAELRGADKEDVYRAAHVAEVRCGGGMGDVAGIVAGGASVRIREGFAPYGMTSALDLDGEVLLAVLGRPLRTSDVLSGEEVFRRIALHGGEALEAFLESPRWDRLFQESLRFAQAIGVMSFEVRDALVRLQPFGSASMCMLGNSVFFRGDLDAAASILGADAWRCRIDHAGPCIISGSDRQ